MIQAVLTELIVWNPIFQRNDTMNGYDNFHHCHHPYQQQHQNYYQTMSGVLNPWIEMRWLKRYDDFLDVMMMMGMMTCCAQHTHTHTHTPTIMIK